MGTIIENYSCTNTEEHAGHPTEGTRSYTCDGKTRCGEQTHEPHRVVEEPTTLWCRGICKCPFRNGIHTPAAHK